MENLCSKKTNADKCFVEIIAFSSDRIINGWQQTENKVADNLEFAEPPWSPHHEIRASTNLSADKAGKRVD